MILRMSKMDYTVSCPDCLPFVICAPWSNYLSLYNGLLSFLTVLSSQPLVIYMKQLLFMVFIQTLYKVLINFL